MTAIGYPTCKYYGLEVTPRAVSPEHITWRQIWALPESEQSFVLDGLYRQTVSIEGPYPWDVERLLRAYMDRAVARQPDPVLHEDKEPHGTDA